jgi:tetratricopeptide (TPR) repeat protein
VVYTQPVVVESPSYVVVPQVATYTTGATVVAPEVSYVDESQTTTVASAQQTVVDNGTSAYQAPDQQQQGVVQQQPQADGGQVAPDQTQTGQAPAAESAAPVTEAQTQAPETLQQTAPQAAEQPQTTARSAVVTPEQAAPAQAEQAAPAQTEQSAAPTPDAQAQAPEQPAIPTEKLQQMMLEGTKAFAEGKYTLAADGFETVTKADPQNVDAALAHAVARFSTGEYTKSAESIRQGVSLFPPIVDTTFDLRERYTKTADFIAQARRLEEQAGRTPNDANALLVLGFVRHFSNQRDLGREAFQQLAKVSPADKELADVFLNANSSKAAAEATSPTTAPAGATSPASAAPATGAVVTSQPSAVEAARSEPANPGVLSVTTQPAPAQAAAEQQKVEEPGEALFNGKLGLIGEQTPREQTTVDGILVRLKGTDDDPPQAYLEILIGERRMKVKRFVPGARVELKGVSGQAYKLFLTEVDNKAESISYVIAK